MNTLQVIEKVFHQQKTLAEKTFAQLSEKDFDFIPEQNSNSIALLIQHIAGNQKSRFTNFLTTDGEKKERNRDQEFEEHHFSKDQLLVIWNEGWNCLFTTISQLKLDDLSKDVFIRGEKHSVEEALIRQVSHYSYHVGQIVLLAKIIKRQEWSSLSIPKGKSDEFNHDFFSKSSK